MKINKHGDMSSFGLPMGAWWIILLILAAIIIMGIIRFGPRMMDAIKGLI